MNFRDIIGQSPLVENLQRSIRLGRVVHAYLISGPKGAGKKMLAHIFARALLCRHSGDRPCDACPSCIKYNTGNHPDVITVKAEKSSIVVDQIRDLQKDMYVKPYEGGRKIYLIEEVHTMTPQAQNCLLKTLEEPPAYGVIFLLADQLEGLLPTILSRCQILRLKKVSRERIAALLEERYGLSPEQAHLIAALSDGRVGRALELAVDQDYMELRREVLGRLEALAEADIMAVFNLVPFFTEHRDQQSLKLEILEWWFRDVYIWKEMGDESLIVNQDAKELLEKQAELFTSSTVQDIIKRIEESKKQLGSSVNAQFIMENLLLSIMEGKQTCLS
ncbi:MAG: DNA polymerase III subunit delta' [Clostridia bacterium]